MCVTMISLKVWRFGSLHIVRDDDNFGSLEVCKFCMMMISLEIGKFGSLHTVCDDDKFGCLEVYKFTCCV